MKKLFYLAAFAAIISSGCRKIVEDGNTVIVPGPNPGNGTTGQAITLKGKLDKDTVLRAANSYTLEGIVYVTNGATLTIEAGTIIKGQFTDPVGGLVITRGAKINATGTVDKPIVFTSASSTPR